MNTLEIVIPTFNRAEHLYRTLCALQSSPFAGSKITVLDNASTDATPKVAALFPSVIYIRNPRNIGAERNYCRAVEISKGPYVWILGDDDAYCWQHGLRACERMIETILAADVDLIMPRVTFDRLKLEGKLEYSLAALAACGQPIFYCLGFVPALIFKRSLYDDSTLSAAKRWADRGNLLPMMPFINSMVARDASIWISDLCHIDKGLRHGYSSVNALRDWITIARALHIGPAMMREMFAWPNSLRNIVGSLLCDPAAGRLQRFRSLCENYPPAQWFWPVALMPNRLRSLCSAILTLSEFDGDRAEKWPTLPSGSELTYAPAKIG